MILTQINDNLEVLETLKSLRVETLASNEVKLAVDIFQAYQNKDIDKYFKLFKSAPYLITCCCTYSLNEMRKRTLRVFSKTILRAEVLDGKMSNVFRIDLDTLADLLCFNDANEASSFLPTLGYQVIKNPINNVLEVLKEGEPGEIWKPRTNYKFIEAKKVIGDKINSRADIIRGLSCRSDAPRSFKARAKVSIPVKPIAVTPPKPSIPEISKKKLEEEQKAKEAELERKKKEQEQAKKEAREALEKQLKDQMKAQKEKEEEAKREREKAEQARKAQLELDRKQAEERKEKARKEAEEKRLREELIRKQKEAEEKRRQEVERRKKMVTERNQTKRKLELLKIYFDKFKKYHEKKRQIKKFVEACLIGLYSKPKTAIRNMPETMFDVNQDLFTPELKKESFTNALVYLLNQKLRNEVTTSKTENIHFRITTFFTKPDEDSRESSLFNNWLVKLLSNSKKSLNTLTRKFVGKTVEDK